MDSVIDFLSENIWIVAVLAVVLYLVIDEVFGITRKVFGDKEEEFAEQERAERKAAAEGRSVDEPSSEETIKVTDFVEPKKRH